MALLDFSRSYPKAEFGPERVAEIELGDLKTVWPEALHLKWCIKVFSFFTVDLTDLKSLLGVVRNTAAGCHLLLEGESVFRPRGQAQREDRTLGRLVTRWQHEQRSS